jgi:hypothetical protein
MLLGLLLLRSIGLAEVVCPLFGKNQFLFQYLVSITRFARLHLHLLCSTTTVVATTTITVLITRAGLTTAGAAANL